MGSIYRSGGGSRGSIYRSGGGGGTLPVGTASTSGGKKKGKSGLLGIAERTGQDLYHAAVNAPAGFGQELYREVKHLPDVIANPGASVKLTAGDAANVAKGTLTTLEHPLRHPGDTLLTVLPFAEGAARLAEAGSALRAGESAADVTKALRNRGHHAGQSFQTGDLKVTTPASRSALGRAGQKAHAKVIRSSEALTTRRVGKELAKKQDVVNAAERGHAAALIAAGKKLKPAEQTALRTAAEGVPTRERIAYHEGRARGVGTAERARHEAKIKTLHESTQYLDETGTRPRISDAHPKLKDVYQETVKSAKGREQLLEQVGKMTPEAAQGRIHAPGRLIVHGEENLVTAPSGQVSVRIPTAAGESVYALERDVRQSDLALRQERGKLTTLEQRLAKPSPTGIRRPRPKLKAAVAKQRESVTEWQKIADTAHEALTTKGPRLEPAISTGEIRVPYPRPGDMKASLRAARPAQVRAAKSVSYPQTPGSLVHPFLGVNLKTANFADETTRAVGESNLEAQRYTSLLRLRDELKKAAKPVPTSEKHDIPMRLDNLKSGTLKPAERALVDKMESGTALTAREKDEAASLFETVRSRIFPEPARMTPEDHAAYLKLAEEGKIAWVDRRLLRGLDKQAPKLDAILGKKLTAAIDATNNAARVGIFYGKPGYIAPNVLGNVALNLIHQGFLAVPNIAGAFRMDKTLGPELTARVDEMMGEGISRTLSAHEGIGSRGINFVAGKYSKVTDRPFRRAAFRYEAKRAGYNPASRADMERLLTSQGQRDDLVTVTRRAKAEILDFDNLTPRERELVRRVVFVYPFLKAATKYAGTITREHPVKTGVLGQLGAAGYQQNQKDLAPFPSYFEGAFKVGGSQQRPLVVNPSGVNILQPPAQIAAALAALATGNTNFVSAPSNFTSPAASFIGDLLGGKGVGKAGTNLVTGLPQYLLGQRIAEATSGGGTTRLYPPTTGTAIGQFLAGSISPRYSSTAGRAKAAAREKSGR